jgi:hypothetical protein
VEPPGAEKAGHPSRTRSIRDVGCDRHPSDTRTGHLRWLLWLPKIDLQLLTRPRLKAQAGPRLGPQRLTQPGHRAQRHRDAVLAQQVLAHHIANAAMPPKAPARVARLKSPDGERTASISKE